MLKSLLSVVLVAGCLYGVSAYDDQCDAEPDNTVYSFAHSYSDFPFEYLNDDGELAGLAYDIVRSVCKIMHKKCTQSVYFDYAMAWDGDKSLALNNRWYDVVANWYQTTRRVAAYSFFGEFSKQDTAYMYVREGSSLDSAGEIRRNANSFGFRLGFFTSPSCLGKSLGTSMNDKTTKFYETTEDLVQALKDREVDVIFGGVNLAIDNYDDVSRISDEPSYCAKAGASMMTRKDMAHKFTWFDVGLAKMRDNGDYDWLCNINGKDVNPRCL